MRGRRRASRTAIAGVAAAALTLTACTAASDGTEGESAPGSPSGSVTFLSAENLSGRWNPFNHSLLSQDRLQRAAYESLVTTDENMEYQPLLATAWSNPEPEIWEFDLRSDVEFHDGTPFTAEDVKASIEYVSNPEVAGSFAFPNQFTAEVVDDYTVRIDTGEPFAAMLSLLSSGVSSAIAPSELIESGELDERFVGTGPYRWVSYEGEETGVHLTANEEYWGEIPRVKDYHFRFVGDSQTRMAALQSGQAQIVDRVAPDEIPVIEETDGLNVLRTDTVESKWVAFRTMKPPMDDPLVRQAIAHAIDRETIVDAIMNGSGGVNTSFLTAAQDFSEESDNFPSYDPDRARELLAEAGYPNGEGLRELLFYTSVGFYPKTREYGEYIVQNLADVGISVELQTLEVARYNQLLFDPQAGDLFDHGWFIASADPEVMLLSLFRNALVSGEPLPAVVEALEQESSVMDPEERAELFHSSVLPTLESELPSFPIFSSELATGYSESVHGLEVRENSYFQIQDVWVD